VSDLEQPQRVQIVFCGPNAPLTFNTASRVYKDAVQVEQNGGTRK